MMITGDLKWYAVEKILLDAVYNGLTTKPDRWGIVPGAIPWDACDCGMLAVSWAQTWLSDTFPDEQTAVVGNCDAVWEVSEIVIQLIRCAPGPDSQGKPPTSKAQDTAAQLVAVDGNQLERLVSWALCQMKEDGQVSDAIMGRRTSQGPEGNCVGSELRVSVALGRG